MNKLTAALLICTFSSLGLSCKDDEEVISETDLPQAARDFIQLHFPGETIRLLVRDNERTIDYDVWLNNGFSLEFDEAGIWNQIDGKEVAIPSSIMNELPEALTNYLSGNYGEHAVVSLDIDNGDYEVGLSTGMELYFEANGIFIRIDD